MIVIGSHSFEPFFYLSFLFLRFILARYSQDTCKVAKLIKEGFETADGKRLDMECV